MKKRKKSTTVPTTRRAGAADLQRPVTRRAFLGGALAAGASFTIVPRHVLGGPGHKAPSEVVTRAVIGCGQMGLSAHVLPNEEGQPPVTLAVCDVDRGHLGAAVEKVGRSVDAYTDWRKVLERTDIDVIHIATPPHWHAVIAVAAIQAGFDTLVEKPFTRTIHEGKVLRDTARRFGRVVSTNTWFRYENYYEYGATARLRKLVKSGLLGSPLVVRVGPGQGMSWKVAEWSGRTDLTPQPVPSDLDYDMWLGPAPVKPYHPHRVHQSFRGYWDYDGGGLADMGQHYLDPIQHILGKDGTSPTDIQAIGPWPPHPDAIGMWGEVQLRYADGDTIYLMSGEWGPPPNPRAALIKGPKGAVYRNYETDPPGLFARADALLPDADPLINFETAVKTRQRPSLDESAAHRSCTLVNLANAAIRLGRPLQYDPVREEFKYDEQANRLLRQPMRAPWRV